MATAERTASGWLGTDEEVVATIEEERAARRNLDERLRAAGMAGLPACGMVGAVPSTPEGRARVLPIIQRGTRQLARVVEALLAEED